MLRTPAVAAKFAALGSPRGVPHGDTVVNVMAHSEVAEVQEVVSARADYLIRSKLLDQYRLAGGSFLVLIDATGTISSRQPFHPAAHTQTHNGITTYSMPVLEAKLACSSGLTISLMTEFIENTDPNASKQDCELKAFKRLARRLKDRFPRLALTLGLDGLYACGPVLDICRQNHWHHIITFKEGSLPSVYQEFLALNDAEPDQHIARRFVAGSDTVEQRLSWVNDITHVDSDKRQHVVSVASCVETVSTTQRRPRRWNRTTAHDGTVTGPPPKVSTTTFRWIADRPISANIILSLTDYGRRRWRVEDGFNSQKNRGDMFLEHAYSYHPVASKVFYLVLQLAHLIIQLLRHGGLLKGTSAEKVQTMRNLAACIREAWRMAPCIPALLAHSARIQFRLAEPRNTS